jgi:hypothetical protein
MCSDCSVNRNGKGVDNGMGTDLVNALLDLIPRMLPRDQKEYRQD